MLFINLGRWSGAAKPKKNKGGRVHAEDEARRGGTGHGPSGGVKLAGLLTRVRVMCPVQAGDGELCVRDARRGRDLSHGLQMHV